MSSKSNCLPQQKCNEFMFLKCFRWLQIMANQEIQYIQQQGYIHVQSLITTMACGSIELHKQQLLLLCTTNHFPIWIPAFLPTLDRDHVIEKRKIRLIYLCLSHAWQWEFDLGFVQVHESQVQMLSSIPRLEQDRELVAAPPVLDLPDLDLPGARLLELELLLQAAWLDPAWLLEDPTSFNPVSSARTRFSK